MEKLQKTARICRVVFLVYLFLGILLFLFDRYYFPWTHALGWLAFLTGSGAAIIRAVKASDKRGEIFFGIAVGLMALALAGFMLVFSIWGVSPYVKDIQFTSKGIVVVSPRGMSASTVGRVMFYRCTNPLWFGPCYGEGVEYEHGFYI